MIKLILQIYRFIQIPTQGFTGEPKNLGESRFWYIFAIRKNLNNLNSATL